MFDKLSQIGFTCMAYWAGDIDPEWISWETISVDGRLITAKIDGKNTVVYDADAKTPTWTHSILPTEIMVVQ